MRASFSLPAMTQAMQRAAIWQENEHHESLAPRWGTNPIPSEGNTYQELRQLIDSHPSVSQNPRLSTVTRILGKSWRPPLRYGCAYGYNTIWKLHRHTRQTYQRNLPGSPHSLADRLTLWPYPLIARLVTWFFISGILRTPLRIWALSIHRHPDSCSCLFEERFLGASMYTIGSFRILYPSRTSRGMIHLPTLLFF